MITAEIKLSLKGLHTLQAEVNNPRGPIRDAFKQWEHRYKTFIQRRFKRNSRGGGDWPPLKYARRRGRRDRASILIDTGTLFKAIDPAWQGSPGALSESIPYGVRVGYGGPHTHPKAGISIADLAAIHDQGLGRVPKRQIIVPPDQSTITSMANDMQRALNKLADNI